MTVTAQMRRKIKMIMRQNGYWSPNGNARRIDSVINQRADIAARINAVAERGTFGLVVRGRDCDGTAYHYEYLQDVPRSIFAFHHQEMEAARFLDGPCSTSYVRPDTIENGLNITRDLALEAFENGHPQLLAA